MKEVVVTYPDQVEQDVQLSPEELAQEIRLMAALKMFELGKLSSGQAAQLAGTTRMEFLDLCAKYHVSIFNYRAEEIEDELRADIDEAVPTNR